MASNEAAVTTVRDLVQSAGEYSFTVVSPSAEHRVRFWGDVPPGAGVVPALAVALIPAMAAGGSLVLPGDPGPQVTRALPDIQAFLAHIAAIGSSENRALTPVKVVAEAGSVTADREPRSGSASRGVGAFFSCGVDSWATLLANPDVTDLIYVHGFDIPIDKPEISATVERRVESVAAQLGKRLHIVRTDIRSLVDETVLWDVSHGPALGAVALLFEPICGRVLIAGSTPFSNLVPRGSHPLHDHLWSTEGCRIEHDGAHLTRAQKVEAIAEHRVALDVLRVCWEHVDEYNCCRCEKCLRAMVSLEALGALEDCPTFPLPLDLEAVASLDVSDPAMTLWWEENLDLALRHDAPPHLVAAIEACLSSVDRSPSNPETLRARLAEAEARADGLERELGLLRNSRSWRLGEPLRKAGAAARRLRRRGAGA